MFSMQSQRYVQPASPKWLRRVKGFLLFVGGFFVGAIALQLNYEEQAQKMTQAGSYYGYGQQSDIDQRMAYEVNKQARIFDRAGVPQAGAKLRAFGEAMRGQDPNDPIAVLDAMQKAGLHSVAPK